MSDTNRNDCPVCKDWCGPKSKKISHKRASNTAHVLAMKKADEGIKGLEWTEVYGLFFPKIYKHEFERNLKLEREIELEESVKRNMHNRDVCAYHCENIGWMEDGLHEKTMKKLRRWYSESKWPNSLEEKDWWWEDEDFKSGCL